MSRGAEKKMRRSGREREGTIGVTRGRGPGCNQLSVIAHPGEGGAIATHRSGCQGPHSGAA